MAMKKHKEATAQEQSCAVASFLFFRVERTDQNEDSADHIDCRDRSRARRPLGSSGSALSLGYEKDGFAFLIDGFELMCVVSFSF